MIRPLLFLLALAAAAAAQEPRTFTDARGRQFSAKLVAADAYRVTIDMPNTGKVTVPQTALSQPDIAFLKTWREQNPKAPLIDPAAMAPWPAQAAAPAIQVRQIEATPKSASWESPHFNISSDLKLPLGVVRDLALVFESTREALLVCPLGVAAGNEKEKYGVRMFQRPVDYMFNGGLAGSAGRFNGHEMLILLPELGIKATTNGLTSEHQKNLFILKHEVTHLLLMPSGLNLPIWASEGFAECVASWPYTPGRYSLQSADSAMHDYLVKWRKPTDRKALTLYAPTVLMALTPDDWQNKVRAGESYDYYNSAALLTHYFLFHDGKGDSASLAAYFAALRGGATAEYAEGKHLLRGRSPSELLAEVRKLAAKIAPEAVFEDAVGERK